MSVYFADKSYGYEENMEICHFTNVVDNQTQTVAARLSVEAKSLATVTFESIWLRKLLRDQASGQSPQTN